MEWQPIETAPKDGTVILLHAPRGWIAAGYWAGEGGGKTYDIADDKYPWLLLDAGELNALSEATHWMPLPEPPKGA